ncbi:right-handed parallel beta-helix repeat-containing protein [Candidatus Bathyarchaeota archaeon]|nr:right-handed parallel beta-helix repeat-containing protein [Candidatus Bathyarchaeota archaeon]
MRRVCLFFVLAFLLLFTVFSVLNVGLVRGAEFITINADGSVTGTSNIVSGDNATYTFTGNITGYITVERNNIVIDGAGYTLEGAGDQDDTGIFLSGMTNVTVRNTRIVNFEVGVWIFAYSSNNTVTENTFVANDFPLSISVSSYNTVSENVLTDNNNGIWLDTAIGYGNVSSNYNLISGNNITLSFWDAIALANGASNNTIIGNNAVNNQYGITIGNLCNDNIVSGNFVDMTESGWGIRIEYHGYRNIISGNNIRNSGYGFYFFRASYNNISENNVVDSTYGVYFFESPDNKFWHNNFIENTQQVDIDLDSANVWDDGYPSGGNYWSDYSGSDANGDGIGDTPYIIDANNTDNYPLMTALGVPVEKSFNVTVGETDYVITTVSNSTVSDLIFNQTLKQLSLNVTGPSGTTGFCNITVPAELMSGDFTLYLDDAALVEGVDYTESFNGTHYLFSVTYAHSTHVIDLFSTEVVPDFASWLFIPFLISATTLGLALRRRLKQQKPA